MVAYFHKLHVLSLHFTSILQKDTSSAFVKLPMILKLSCKGMRRRFSLCNIKGVYEFGRERKRW